MTRYKAVDIDWDVDDEEELKDLPTEIVFPDTVDVLGGNADDDEASDYITDLTGFCHRGFSIVECN